MLKSRESYLLFALFIFATMALLLQLWLSIEFVLANGETVFDGVVKYFGFFTILTNMLVAFSSGILLFKADSKTAHFISRPFIFSGITMAIIFVGLVYHLLLRHIWSPQGLGFIANFTLHYIVPLLVLLYWFVYISKNHLARYAPFIWSIYPVAYLLYAFIRGELIGKYPYPFIDVTTIGYKGALLNSVFLFLTYIIIAYGLLGLSYLRAKQAK